MKMDSSMLPEVKASKCTCPVFGQRDADACASVTAQRPPLVGGAWLPRLLYPTPIEAALSQSECSMTAQRPALVGGAWLPGLSHSTPIG